MLPARARHLRAVAALAAVAGLGLAACDTSGDASVATVSTPSSSAPAGTVPLDTPDAKPALTLTDQNGHSYDLVKQTAGHPTLLYFGYTHCPDVCPTTMADIALAARKLPTADRRDLRVVFVSTDPTRDSPRRLKQWLGAIDPSFTGLTGNFATVQKAARSLGVGISAPVKHKDGTVTVSHGAEVLAFSPKDDKAHLLYTSGTSEQRYAADLPKLVKGETP
ncbi:SCO family protein [Streptomyces canus]|uniref:SCO family protein n=1 Tax=Streptomyces canus TaxID=58343 RepID=UPI00225BE806|nr:SCO family protein [Streptomyces canus]MCX4862188.1 SCO family protein [Streptomyces canus]WSW32820.1 SCO family protein [Streptomyces canus]